MEMLSNLAWVAVCLFILGSAVAQIRRGTSRVPTSRILISAFTLCLILLPVISMTDDLLASKQNALPLAAQTWHLAADAVSVGAEPILVFEMCFLFLVAACGVELIAERQSNRAARSFTAWLTRAQRLRPPPVFAL